MYEISDKKFPNFVNNVDGGGRLEGGKRPRGPRYELHAKIREIPWNFRFFIKNFTLLGICREIKILFLGIRITNIRVIKIEPHSLNSL